MEKKISLGLQIYIYSLAIVSFLSFVQGFGMAMTAGSPEPLLRLALVFAPIGLGISSVGLLLLKNWSRYLFIIFAIIMSIVMIYLTLGSSSWVGISSVYIPFLIIGIYLFTRPKVKEQFK